MRVLVFGDSIVFGSYDSQGGWVDRVKRDFLHKHIKGGSRTNIINIGIGGDTSEFLLGRLEPTIQSAIISDKNPVFVCSIGVNDSRMVVDKAGNYPQTGPEQYRKNIVEIINTMKKYTDSILFVGLTTIHPNSEEVFPKTFKYTKERIEQYDVILHEVCHKQNIKIVDVVQTIEGKTEMFFHDKLHLSDLGHQTLAELLLPEIQKLTSK